MADVGDELLDGDLDEATFDDLDGEQEDALLADDNFESYEDGRQMIYSDSSHSEVNRSQAYQVLDQVHEGEEIIEDGLEEEDVLDIAVGDELDESELESSQGNNQSWTESSARTAEGGQDSSKDGSDPVGVSSSTPSLGAMGGESDEEETDGRGSRFRAERTNLISLKGVTGVKSLSDIPDSLDNVKTPVSSGRGMRDRGRGGRGGIRGRLGPHPSRGGMMGRGGMRRMPNMMPPPQMTPPLKILVNPHFRGGLQHGPSSVWDNERLPPPPGCETYVPPPPGQHNKDMGWGGPMPPHHMGRPPMGPHPGPPGPFHQGPTGYPPHNSQNYEDPYRPMMDSPQQNHPNRIVQFNENSQLITVENQHFQRPAYDQNFAPPSNQYQSPPPQFNNMYPPNQFNSSQRPNFPPQPYPSPNPPPNYMGYPQPDFQPPQNPPAYQNYENQNNWNTTPQPMDNQFYPPGQPPQSQPPAFSHPQPTFRPAQPPFPNQNNFRPPPPKQFQGNMRGSVMKRLAPRQSLNTTIIGPPKLMRFDHSKPKTIPVNTRSNLQEIKTVDNLPDTTTKPDPEPDIEEDEETKQYRLKIAEQKALREKILREKEARRLAAILKKQNQSENSTNTVPAANPVQVLQQPQGQTLQVVRSLGRGRGHSANRVIPKFQPKPSQVQPKGTGVPHVQIQNMLGTMYKIVKVRTKEGAIVTRKTPITISSTGTTTSLVKTVSNMTTTTNPNRLVVLNATNQGNSGIMRSGITSVLRGTTNSARLIPSRQAPGRTLFTVQTTPLVNTPRVTAPQRVVIDKRVTNPGMVVAAMPKLPNSCLVTIDNLSLSTSQAQIQKMAKQAGTLAFFSHEPDKRRATLRFQNIQEAHSFHDKFHRKMIDLSRIVVTVVPELSNQTESK